jgi:hypothetical protein
MWVSVTRLPFHSLGLQRPREMLQVLRAPLTAPRLERRARRMVIPNYSGKPDVRLLLVALEGRYMHLALTRLFSFLCWKTAPARVQPRIHIYGQNGREKGIHVTHQSNRGRSLMASSIETNLKGAVPTSGRTARAMSPFGNRTSSLCV